MRKILVRIFIVFALVGCLGIGMTQTTTRAIGVCAPHTLNDTEELNFISLLNNYRTANNLGQLRVASILNGSASVIVNDLAATSRFDHIDSAGGNPTDRAIACGYPSGAGENLAAGSQMDTAQEAFDAWKASPGHNANMLGAGYTEVGVARVFLATSPFGWYWATEFGTANTSAATPTITGLNPSIGPSTGGNVIQITGTGFVTGSTQITFNGVAVVPSVVITPSLVTAIVPAGTANTTSQVRVVAPSGTSNAFGYSYYPVAFPPIIGGIFPAQGFPGDTVRIVGANFTPGLTVWFDGVASPSVNYLNSSLMDVRVPVGKGSPAQVRIGSGFGISPDAGVADDFYFINPPTQTPTPAPTQTPVPTSTPPAPPKVVTYDLSFRWSLVGYQGATGVQVQDAFANVPLTALYQWDQVRQDYLGYFPSATGIPGANQIQTLIHGQAYWVAVSQNSTWSVVVAP